MSMREIENSSDCQSLSIRQKLDITPTVSQIWNRRGRCIYRVPKLQRKVNEEAYTPVLVSIGPFHHGNERLLPMEAHKLMYLHSFIGSSKTSGESLNTYLKIIKEKESQIRECYAEPTDGMPSEEFIQMILIDSVFVIELFRTKEIVPPFTQGDVLHDLQLAENQVPFFILECLYRAAFVGMTNLTHLACGSLGVVYRSTNREPSHLLDFRRSLHLLTPEANTSEEEAQQQQPQHEEDTNDSSNVNRVPGDIEMGGLSLSRTSAVAGPGEPSEDNSILCPTATRLYEAGVKFCVSKTPSSSTDIHFDKDSGILTIPNLLVDASTESFLLNLVAFEQCHYSRAEAYITHYHYFMDCLINTKEDVQLLARAGIIHNWLSTDQQVADLFNTLVSQAFISKADYKYASVAKQLNDHCSKRWNRYIAILKQKYFNHPWAILSVTYLNILLLLAITQVVTGFLALKK